jgi:SNF2 family DNA or RNA helicase
VDYPVTLTKDQKKAYQQITKQMRAEMPSGQVMEVKSAMSRLMRLQQVASGFLGSADEYEYINSGKVEALDDLLDTLHLHEHKVIIWVWYTPTLLRLKDRLKRYNPALFFGDAAYDKDEQIQRFNTDPSCRVLIGNARVGIGCTLNVAPYTVYFDLPYFDTEAWLQSQDRNHRIGQTAEKVTYYRLMSPGIDRTIWRNLSGKFTLQDYYTGDDLLGMAEGKAA